MQMPCWTDINRGEKQSVRKKRQKKRRENGEKVAVDLWNI